MARPVNERPALPQITQQTLHGLVVAYNGLVRQLHGIFGEYGQAINERGPYALLQKTTTESIPSTSFTVIPWDSAVVDTGGFFNGVNLGRLTCPRSGIIVAASNIAMDSGPTQVLLRHTLNGGFTQGLGYEDSDVTGVQRSNIFSGPIEVSEGDILRTEVWQSGAGGNVTLNASVATWASITYLD